MNRFACFLAAALPLFLPMLAQAAEGLPEIRTYPFGQLWAQELEAAHRLHSVVLHNTAVVNRSAAPLQVEAMRMEVLRGDEVVLARLLHARDLDRAAAGGSQLHAAGMMEAVKFQFAPDRLFGTGVKVSATRTLQPGDALYIPVQVFAWPGEGAALRITADFAGTVPDATATLPIRHGSVEGTWRLPLDGRWIAGAASTLHSHHRWAVPEEFAYDFLRFGASGTTFEGDGARVTDYYAYGAPVLAPAEGEVVAAVDGRPDNLEGMRQPGESLDGYRKRLLENQAALLASGLQAIAGNHVILRHREGVHSVYAHLKPGSVRVKPGAKVAAGDVLGEVGQSGNSTEPHLHFHLCDAPDALLCVGLPVAFDNVQIPGAERARQIQSGDLVETVPAGEAQER